MRLLFIGDVVGQPGRRALKELLPRLRQEHAVDLVVANGENAAGGSGITPRTAEEIFASGVDVITSGDHLWDQKDVLQLLDGEPRFVRPLNYPQGTPGHGCYLFQSPNLPPVAIINLQGRTFMPPLDNPFHRILSELERLGPGLHHIFVDFHAEATSEKIAIGWYLDGRVSAVIGTHTHVPTADARVLPGGTAYITDVGMTGARGGVIGVQREAAVEALVTQMPVKFEPSEDDPWLDAVVVRASATPLRADGIEQLLVPAPPGFR